MNRFTFLCASFGAATIAPIERDAAAARSVAARLHGIERSTGGRLGVYAFAPATRHVIARWRQDERFPLCSTFKLIAAGAVLARVDRGTERLERRVPLQRADLLTYAPVTRAHLVRGSMTVGELCAAAVEFSDNTAANLLLRALGGPAAATRFARSIGDRATRFDRTEPALNTAIPGDVRDTSTPRAMAQTLAALCTTGTLRPRSRALLIAWLTASTTGGARLRAGLPPRWRTGDKTGTGDHGTRNDVAITWPSTGPPLIIAAYLTGATVSEDAGDAALAAVGEIVAAAYRPSYARTARASVPVNHRASDLRK